MKRMWRNTAAAGVFLLTSGMLAVVGGRAATAGDCFADVVRVAADQDHTVVARDDGTVWAWGRNQYGQLGDGTTVDSATPKRAVGLDHVIDVAGGDTFTIALRSDGTVWAWGSNAEGVFGDGTTTTHRTVPGVVPGLTGVTAIAAGSWHVVALLADGSLRSWGYNYQGQAGDGSTTTLHRTPVTVTGLAGVTKIASTKHHTFAQRTDGTVWGWGYNGNNQISPTAASIQRTPVRVAEGLSGIVALAPGGEFSAVLLSDGTIRAWGSGSVGQLGNGSTANSSVPVPVAGLSEVTGLSAGVNHTIARRRDGTAWAWGWNNFGQLGDGTQTNRLTPVPVSSPPLEAFAAGVTHSIAIHPDTTAWSWGNNFHGQLGRGTPPNGIVVPGRIACPTPPAPPPAAADWALKTVTVSPGGRFGASMAYHSRLGLTVLFGGAGTGSTRFGDTWTWNGTAWTQMAQAGPQPAPRSNAAMIYDKLRDRVVLFGGITGNGTRLNDTWTWDGLVWMEVNLTSGAARPPARDSAAAAYYDTVDGHVVLFGGSGAAGTMGDTWTWDGAVWAQRTGLGGPAPRVAATLAHHTAATSAGGAKYAVLFGGLSGATTLGDTWGWNGHAWTSLGAAWPRTGYYTAAAFDRSRHRIVTFGGCSTTGFTACPHGDTWTWHGAWTQATPVPAPVSRYGAAMTFDTQRQVTVLFGGAGCLGACVLGDTWTY